MGGTKNALFFRDRISFANKFLKSLIMIDAASPSPADMALALSHDPEVFSALAAKLEDFTADGADLKTSQFVDMEDYGRFEIRRVDNDWFLKISVAYKNSLTTSTYAFEAVGDLYCDKNEVYQLTWKYNQRADKFAYTKKVALKLHRGPCSMKVGDFNFFIPQGRSVLLYGDKVFTTTPSSYA